MGKMFTLGEAHMLLPVLEALIERARGRASQSAVLEIEMDDLRRSIALAGGMHVDIRSAARKRAERDKAAQEATDAAGEIEEIGARIHDLEVGMLDIPCQLDGEAVMLCWKIGEATIEYWHKESEQPVERISLDSRFGRGERQRPN